MAKLKCKDCKYNHLESHDGSRKGNFCSYKYKKGAADLYISTSLARRTGQFCGRNAFYWKESWGCKWRKLKEWAKEKWDAIF